MNLYILNLNGTEAGPFTEQQLRAMWLTGGVTVNTDWRLSDVSEWRSGAELPARMEPEPTRSYKVKDYSPGLLGVREKLRGGTAYPVLRGCLIAIIVLGILGAVICVIALFNDDARPLGITGLIASLSSIFSSFVTMVILDGVDALLAKID